MGQGGVQTLHFGGQRAGALHGFDLVQLGCAWGGGILVGLLLKFRLLGLRDAGVQALVVSEPAQLGFQGGFLGVQRSNSSLGSEAVLGELGEGVVTQGFLIGKTGFNAFFFQPFVGGTGVGAL